MVQEQFSVSLLEICVSSLGDIIFMLSLLI